MGGCYKRVGWDFRWNQSLDLRMGDVLMGIYDTALSIFGTCLKTSIKRKKILSGTIHMSPPLNQR